MAESSNIRVAVVGASSQIGQALLPRLAAAGYISYCIGRESRNLVEGTTTYVFEETSRCFFPQLDSIDVVVSLAPLPSIEVVVKMAQALGAKRIIAFGSTGRFSKLGSTSIIEQDFVLQQEQAEVSFSARCKSLNIAWTLFRPTMIYGANADQNVSFIKSMVHRFGFFPMPIGANGLRQPVHVDDLAAACIAVLGRNKGLNKAYNLGGGDIIKYSELVRRIFLAEGKSPFLLPVPKWVYRFLIQLAVKLNIAPFARFEMVERMYADLTVNNQSAVDDFGFSPKEFR